MVIITGQLLPRYFLEIYLGICFIIGNLKKTTTIEFLRKISFIQIIIIFIFSFSFMTLGISKLYPFKEKLSYQSNFSFSFFNAIQVNNLELNENILHLHFGRDTLFFDNNVYSSRSIDIMKKFSNNKNYFVDFIRLNNIRYIVSLNKLGIPKCIETKHVGKLEHFKAMRNFLVKNRNPKAKLSLFKIISINCGYD